MSQTQVETKAAPGAVLSRLRDSEQALRVAEARHHEILQNLPMPVYTTDAEGRITFFNRASVAFSGHEPQLGSDSWCVSWKLFTLDGERLPHDACPMAQALTEGVARHGVDEALAERPDGSRRRFTPFATPLFDDEGRLSGGLNVLVDVTDYRGAQGALARRAQQQAALYRFTDQLYRARDADEVYAAALDAMAEALGCERASVSLTDGEGVLRFVAWRGLSEGYRRAVEGHNPWRGGDPDPQPIWVRDIDETHEPEAIKQVVRAEGICGLAFIPLVAGGALAGKFMLYYPEPHAFTAEETDLAVTFGRQLGFALEQRRDAERRAAAEAKLRDRERRLSAMFQRAGVGMVLLDSDGAIQDANPAFCDILGRPLAALAGASNLDFSHPDDLAVNRSAMARLADEDGPVVFEQRYRLPSGEAVWVRLNLTSLGDGQVLAVVEDIDARRRAEEQRLLLINELNHRVKNSLATVQSIASQTLRSARSLPEARAGLEERLVSLAGAHDMLTVENWSGARLSDVVGRAVEPFGGRFRLLGEEVRLTPSQALALALALNELAVNAVKYGALAGPEGMVEVSWTCCGDEVRLSWREGGGPAVDPPPRRGFGSRLIERGLPAQLGGRAELRYAPGGLECDIAFPLEPGAPNLLELAFAATAPG